MKKQKAHGCQFTNVYVASIPSELRVIIGSTKSDVEAVVQLITDSTINQVFSQSVHVISRYDVMDLRLPTEPVVTESEIMPEAEVSLVVVAAKTASKKKKEESNETISETGVEPSEEPNGEPKEETQDGDTYQSLKRKRGGRKPSA